MNWKVLLLAFLLSTSVVTAGGKKVLKKVPTAPAGYSMTVNLGPDSIYTQLLSNTTFDADTVGWQGFNYYLTWNSDINRIHDGAGSAKLRTTGSQSWTGIYTPTNISNTTSDRVHAQVWIYNACASAKTVRIHVISGSDWGALLDITGNTVTMPSGTWNLVGVQGQLPGTQTNLKMTIQITSSVTAADSFYFDSPSMVTSHPVQKSQYWETPLTLGAMNDFIAYGSFKTTSTGVQEIFNTTKNTQTAIQFYLNNNTPTAAVGDGTTTIIATNSAVVNDGKIHSYAVSGDHAGNLTLWIDGVAGTGVSMASLGTINIDTLRLGKNFNGTLGQTVLTKVSSVSGVASFVKQQTTRVRSGSSLLVNKGTVVFNTTWQKKGKDYSSLHNDLLAFGYAYPVKYYVSAAGNDANNGRSVYYPWKTISHVNTQVLHSGDSILFHANDTFTGSLSVGYGGVTISSYGAGNKPVISGGTTLTGWTLHSGSIYKTKASAVVKNLIIDDKLQVIARTPNTGYYTVTTTNGSTYVRSPSIIQSSNYWQGATMRIKTQPYRIEGITVSASVDSTLTVPAASYSYRTGYGFYLDNKLALLDTTDEWYCNPADSMVYMYGNPDGKTIIGSVVANGVVSNQNDLTIKGLAIKYQSNNGIYINNNRVSNLSITDNEFAYQWQNGIWVDSTSTNSYVARNIVHDANGGIVLNRPVNAIISNNSVYRLGLVGHYGSIYNTVVAISSEYGDYSTISGNIIDSTAYVGIIHNGRNSLVENNIITNTLLRLADGGAIYSGTWTPGGAPYHSENSVVRNNIIKNVVGNNDGIPVSGQAGAIGVYFDDHSFNMEAYNNTLINVSGAGIYLHNNDSSMTIHNNIIYKCASSPTVTGVSLSVVISEDSIAHPGYSIKRNIIFPLNNDKFFVGTRQQIFTSDATLFPRLGSWDSNYYCNPYNMLRPFNMANKFGSGAVSSFSQWQNGGMKLDSNSFEITPPVTVVGSEMLTNTTFDANVTGWICSHGTMSWTTEQKHTGVGAALWTTASSTSSDIFKTAGFDVTPGKTYRVTLWARSNRDIRHYMRLIDQSGATAVSKEYYSNVGKFIKMELIYTNVSATQLHPEIYEPTTLTSSDSLWFDDASLREVTVVTPDDSLFVNATSNVVTYDLSEYSYNDLDGNAVTSLTLQPYSSKLLLSSSHYYVSNLGNDSNDGHSRTTPWLTLSKASSAPAGSTIRLRAGDTFAGQLNLAGDRITVSSYGTGNKPVISGGVTLTGWTLHSGAIYKTKASGIVKNLFVNDVQQTIARWPNKVFSFVTSTTDSSTRIVSTGMNQATGYWTGATLHMRTTQWEYERRTVTSWDGTTLVFPAMDYKYTPRYGFYLDNKLAALDTVGEWYCGSDSTIYYWAQGGVDPNTLTVIGTVNDYGIRTTADSITINGLSVKYQNVAGISIAGTTPSNVSVLNNAISLQNMHGISIDGSYGDHCLISDNTVTDCNGNGINAGLRPDYLTIANNTVKRIGLIAGYGVDGDGGMDGIMVFGGNYNTMRYNFVDSCGYIGINPYGAFDLVEYNYIRNTLLRTTDGGGIYTSGYLGIGHDVTIRNNIVENTIGNGYGSPYGGIGVSVCGIYLDNAEYNMTVTGNTVINATHAGIFIATDYTNVVRDNTCYSNGASGLMLWKHGTAFPSGSTVVNNIIVPKSSSSSMISSSFKYPWVGTLDSNYYINKYDGISDFNYQEYVSATSTYFNFSFNGWSDYFGRDLHSVYKPTTAITNLGANLVNGSFDTDISGWSATAAHTVISRTTSDAYSGSGCLLSIGVKDTNLTYASFCRTTNPVTVTPRHTYTSTGWVKSNVYRTLNVTNQNQGSLFIGTYQSIRLMPGVYTKFSITNTVDSVTTGLKLLIMRDTVRTGDSTWIDNVSITETQPAVIGDTLFVNNTSSPITFNLQSTTYVDVDDRIYNGLLTLQPYTSKLLFIKP